jgi:hypothetical protein
MKPLQKEVSSTEDRLNERLFVQERSIQGIVFYPKEFRPCQTTGETTCQPVFAS